MLIKTIFKKKETCCVMNNCSVYKDNDMKISELEIKNKILNEKLAHYENPTNDKPGKETPSSIPCTGCKELKVEIGKLYTIIQKLNDTIALLKGGRDSRISSTAPSTDLSRSNRNSLRTPSGKKTGGQMGHVGHTLPLLSETPDEIIDHTSAACSYYGKNIVEVLS